MYNFLTLEGPTDESNSFSNWQKNLLKALSINASNFGIYVFALTGQLLEPKGTIDVEFGTVPPAGTFAVAYGQDSAQAIFDQSIGDTAILNLAGTPALTFWDGPGPHGNGVVNGGTGTWTAAASDQSWTDSTGIPIGPWHQNGFATFEGTPGTVTVTDGAGNVTFIGADFEVSGYTITGQGLTTSTANTILNVGNGTPAGAATTATINAVLEGTGGINKTDLGTLVLGGANTYSGGTTITAGTLSISSDSNLGALGTGLTFNGGVLLTTAGVTSPRPVTMAANGTIETATNSDTFSGVVSGPGALTITGGGIVTLSNAANTYAGGTTVIGNSTVSVTSDSNLGASGTLLTLDAGTLLTTASLTSTRPVTLDVGGGTVNPNGDTVSLTGIISGPGALTTVGSGVLILTGANTYSGGTTIGGTSVLELNDFGTTGTGNILNNSRLAVDRSDVFTLGALISGTGSLVQGGTGTTILTANNTYTGGTSIFSGTLQLGNGGTSGSVMGNIVNLGALVIDRGGTVTLPGVISGTGTVTQAGPGTATLTANNTYTGTTMVTGGTLLINGNQTAARGAVSVASGATLGGIGTTGGNVTVANGGHLVGSQGQIFSMNSLTLNPTSQVDVTLTAPGTIGLFNINGNGGGVGAGNLTLAGNLNITAPGTFEPGVYRIMDYTGTLTNNGMTFGTVPVGSTPNVDLFIQTSVPSQVNLVNALGVGPLNFWDGNNPALFNNGVVNGGTGTWPAAGIDAFTNSTGLVNAPWQANGFAIFQATPGIVTVDNSAGSVTFSGAQFAVDGYTITGGPLTTTTANTILRVGDGTMLGAAMTATISAVIQGSGGINKEDLGTLVLSGANTYTGGTTITAGTLSVGSDTNLGDPAGGLTFNGGTLLTTASVTSARTVTLGAGGGTVNTGANSDSFSGVVSGSGALTLTGGGTVTLTNGANTYAGGTTVTGGTTLSISSDTYLGASGTLLTLDAGTLLTTASLTSARPVTLGVGGGTVNPSGDTIFLNGIISGAGALTEIGSGVLILTGANTYSGGTTIGGTSVLELNDFGTTGTGNIGNNSRLAVDRSDTFTLGALISGTGALVQGGTGTTILTANNTYAGTTSVFTGTLLINGNQTAATGAVSVVSGAALGGTGTTGANVTVANGGHLVGSQGQIFSMNALTLNPTSQVDVTLTSAGGIGLFNINGNGGGAGAGNLTLAGNLNVTAPGAFLPGVYRIMDYTGALTNNGMTFGTVPPGFTPNVDLFIETAVPSEVNLINSKALGPLDFWDGNDPALFDNGEVNGGTGTWPAAGIDAFTDSTGLVNGPWQANGFAIFEATPGTVTVDNSAGPVTFSGAQFAVDGYTITGGPLTTTTADTILRVGDGTALGAAMTATISAVIQGSGGIEKADLGTLILTAANTYTGGTTVSEGTLSISSDANLGDAAGGLTLNGGTLLTTAGVTSGRNVTLGSADGIVDNGGNQDVLTGPIVGSGGLTSTGTGTLTLTGTNTYSGVTTIAAGTLQLGNGGTSGSIAGDIVDKSALVVDRSDAVTLPGMISGTGSVTQAGNGTTTLAGDNTYTGTTTVQAGTLLIDGNQTAATGDVSVASGATLGGVGTTGGNVTVADGGHLLGSQGQIFSMNSLTLNPISQVDVFVTAPGVIGLFNINGNGGGAGAGDLVLDGNLNITASGTFLPGVYRVMDYTGALTNLGMTFGTVPPDSIPNVNLFLETAVPSQVNIVNNLGAGPLNFWDGGNPALFNNGVVNGGSGTWLAAGNTSWTNSTGLVNAPWQTNGFAIFQAAPGTVTVDNSAGAVVFSGAQFAVDGYMITGQALTTTTADTILRVGDGTALGAAMTATINAAIQGSGGIEKVDLGTLVLGGANTYTGGTTVSGGTLSISSDANLGAVPGGLTLNGGTLLTTAPVTSTRSVTLTTAGGTVNNGGNAVTLSGVISGPGGLTATGGGVLTLLGANTYTGGTTVATGSTLQGNTMSLQGSFLDSGMLIFNQSFSGTYGGTISGTGAAALTGGGMLTLLGMNTFTGPTMVANGNLVLGTTSGTSAGVAGPVVVNSSGVLQGFGRVGGALMNNGGLVAPGTSGNIGTLTVGGSYAQSTGGIFASEVTPSAASRLTVGGSASLGGTLALTFDSGTYSARTYTLLSAAPVQGTFGTVTQVGSPGSFLIPTIDYTAAEVDLVLSFPNLAKAASTPNQTAVANALDSTFPTASGDMVTVLNNLLALQTTAQLQAAFDQISGVVYTSVPTVALDNALMATRSVFRQLDNAELLAAAAGPDQPIASGLWVSVLGDTDTYQGDGNAPGFTSQTYGTLVGYDQPIRSGLSVGGVVGTWHKNVTLDQTGATAALTSILLSVYGGYTNGPWMAHAMLGYTFDSDTANRPLSFASLSRTATSSFNPNEFMASVEGGYHYQTGGVTLTPVIGLDYANINMPGFTESGANALNLIVAGSSTSALDGIAGIRAGYVTPTGSGHTVKATGYAEYAHNFESTTRQINVQMQGAPGSPFTVAGVSPSPDGVRVGASIGVLLTQSLELSGSYDVLWSSNQNFQTYQLTLKVHL